MAINISPAHTSRTPENKLLGVISNTFERLVALSPLLFIICYNLLSKLSWLHKQSIAHKCAILALSLSTYLLFNWYVNRTVNTLDKSNASVLNKAIRIMCRHDGASQESPTEIAARWVRIGAYGLVPLTLLSIINHQDKLSKLMSGHGAISVVISVVSGIFLKNLVSTLQCTARSNVPLVSKITNLAEVIVSHTLTGASRNAFFTGHRLVAPPSSNP